MGSLLMYRGLPGGPTEVKFADELSRHCLCSQCGMITLSMYQDPNDHMFCDTCLHERSTKYGKFEIFCTYERKNIGINEMFEARDLITILRDQYVDCPNKPHCKEKVPLENLHDHFVACKRHVQCPNCRESIETKKWKDHHCPLETERAVTKAAEKSGASKEAVKGRERQEKQKPSVLRSSKSRDIEPSSSQRCGGRQTTAVSMSPAETHGRAVAFPQPDQLVAPEERGAAAPMQNSDGGNHVPEAIQVCEYCHRKVKDINMERHQKACTKAPKPCVYCETPFFPDYMQRHIQECNKNPDNVPECNSAAPEPGAINEPPEANCSARTVFDTNRDINIGGGPIWMQYFASGDWLGAFVAMEESFRDSVLDQQDRYARFAPALVSLEQYHCVEDFLAKPSPVQPYYCLLAALLVRKYLPRNVWSRRQEGTWMGALQYMPYFLASELSDEAIAYLCAFPVFLDEMGCQDVGANAPSVAPCQPSPKPGPNGVSEKPSSGEAHGGVNTTETDTPKPDLEGEARATAELGRRGQGKRQAKNRRKGKKRRR